MRTQGLTVTAGSVFETPLASGMPVLGQAVPPQFWNRLRHHMAKRGLLEAFEAEHREEVAAVVAARGRALDFTSLDQELQRERDTFRRWTIRACGPQTIWPWERGWTEELVDSYLRQPVKLESVEASP